MRNWTQKHIEELIEKTAKRLGLTGGGEGEITRADLIKALVGSKLIIPVAHRHQLVQLTATCLEVRENPGFGNFLEVEWQFKLVVQKSLNLDAAVGDTCFMTMFGDIQLFEDSMNLMNNTNGFPREITMGIQGSEGGTLKLRRTSDTQVRVGSGTTRPLLSMSSNFLADYRYVAAPPSGHFTGLWNQSFTY